MWSSPEEQKSKIRSVSLPLVLVWCIYIYSLYTHTHTLYIRFGLAPAYAPYTDFSNLALSCIYTCIARTFAHNGGADDTSSLHQKTSISSADLMTVHNIVYIYTESLLDIRTYNVDLTSKRVYIYIYCRIGICRSLDFLPAFFIYFNAVTQSIYSCCRTRNNVSAAIVVVWKVEISL